MPRQRHMPPYSFGIHLLASGFIGPGTQFEQSRLHPEEELEEEELEEEELPQPVHG